MPDDEIERLISNLTPPNTEKITFASLSQFATRFKSDPAAPEEEEEEDRELIELRVQFERFVRSYLHVAEGRELSITSNSRSFLFNYKRESSEFAEVCSLGNNRFKITIGAMRHHDNGRGSTSLERYNFTTQNLDFNQTLSILKQKLAAHIAFQRTLPIVKAQAALDKASDQVNNVLDKAQDRLLNWLSKLGGKRSIVLPLIFSLASASGGHDAPSEFDLQREDTQISLFMTIDQALS